jgi:hypothetical protein
MLRGVKMLKMGVKKKIDRIKKNFQGKKNLDNFDILSGMLLPTGFSIEVDDQFFSLFYRKKRIASFLATKVIEEKIKKEIKEFQMNKHKYHR